MPFVSSKNPAVRGPAYQMAKEAVPDLDVHGKLNIVFDKPNRKMKVNHKSDGDGFPDQESYLTDPKGNKIFLDSHIRIGSASGQLFGDVRNPMTETTLTVDMNDDYSFGNKVTVEKAWDHIDTAPGTDHLEGKLKSSEISRDEWNKLHESRNPSSMMRVIEDQIPEYRVSTQPVTGTLELPPGP